MTSRPVGRWGRKGEESVVPAKIGGVSAVRGTAALHRGLQVWGGSGVRAEERGEERRGAEKKRREERIEERRTGDDDQEDREQKR